MHTVLFCRIPQLWLLTLLLLVSACSPPEPPLRIGSNPWPGYLGLHYAREQGYFQNHKVKLVDFSNAGDVMRAFRNHAIDAAALTIDEALRLAADHQQLRILWVFDISLGADALLAHPELNGFEDLRDKRLGVETNATGGYMLARMLDASGLSRDDIEIVSLPLHQHVNAFSNGEVDALITFDPHRQTLLNLGAKTLFSSKDIPGEIIDVMVVHEQLLDNRREDLQNLATQFFKALEELKTQQHEAATMLSPRTGNSPEQVLQAWAQLELPGLARNQQLLTSKDELPSKLHTVERVLRQNRLLNRPVDVEAILAPGFINSAQP